MPGRRHLPYVLIAVGCAGPPAGGPPSPAGLPLAPALDTVDLRADTWFLAHDYLQGRGTGTPGVTIAGLHIQARCRALGLEVHELPVPLAEARIVARETRLTVGGAVYRSGDDFVPGGGTARALHGFSGVPVWVGGTAEILGTEATPPLDGRVALTAGPVRPEARAALAGRGAAGIVSLTADPSDFAAIARSRGASILHVADTAVRSSYHPDLPSLVAHPALSRALAVAAQERESVTYTLVARAAPVPASNVACLLRGHDRARAGRWIGYTAHYDHLGIGPPDATGDSVYNGFSDNAAGVAMLLGIARAIRALPERSLGHSVLLLFFTGEERGLLGSDYYVHAPLVPLDSMRAVINLDAGAPPARVWNWRIAGGDGQPLGELARDVAAARGWAATTSPAIPNSDYFPFVRAGVPAVFIIPGTGPYEGLSADSSQALRERWDRYHQPADAWHAEFPFEGLARYAEFALLVGMEVDRRE